LKALGYVLTILGVVAIVYGGVNYYRERTILQVGSFKATTTEQQGLPLSPMAGALALIGGIALLTVPKRGLALNRRRR